MQKKRILWIDLLRGIALFSVVVGHVGLSAGKISLIYSFHMPLFFIISGLTLNDNKIRNASMKEYVLNKAKKLLLPYLWMSFMMYPLWYITFHKIDHTDTTIFQAFKGIFWGNNTEYYSSPSNALWFLLALFFADILYAAIIKVSQGDEFKTGVMIAICAVIGYLEKGVAQIWHINVAFTAVVFLYLGRVFMNNYRANEEWYNNRKDLKKYGIILLLVVIGLISHFQNERISMTANKFGNSFLLFYVTAIAFSLAIMLVVIMLPNIPLINHIGQNTLLYVGVHVPVIRIFEKSYPDVFDKELNCVLLAVGIYFGLLLVCALFNKVFPYVCAKKSSLNEKGMLVGEVVLAFDCGIIPVLAVFHKLGYADNKLVIAVVTLACSIGFVALTEKICPFIYCKEKK